MTRFIIEVEEDRIDDFKKITSENGFEIKQEPNDGVRNILKENLDKIMIEDKEVFEKLAQ